MSMLGRKLMRDFAQSKFLLGAIACIVGVVYTNRARTELNASAERVADRALELLTVVDGKLEVLPGQLTELANSDRPQPVLDKLRAFEDGLQDALSRDEPQGPKVTASWTRLQEVLSAIHPRIPRNQGSE